MALKHKYAPEDHNHEGKLYRVRDKDHGKGEPVIVWGQNLPHEQAHKLKERVCGRGKSTTARLENMEIPAPPTSVTPQGVPLGAAPPPKPSALVTAPTHADPVIASAQAKALAAARAPAAASQARQGLIAIPAHPGAAPVPEMPEIEVPEGIDADLDELMDGEAAAAE